MKRLLYGLISAALFLGIFLSFFRDEPPSESYLTGEAQGSTYRITLLNVSDAHTEDIHDAIKAEFRRIDQVISTYRATSEISRFNADTTGTPFSASSEFWRVAKFAHDIYEKSNGAFDCTVQPLITLWGFHSHSAFEIPSSADIQKALAHVGFHNIEFVAENQIRKRDSNVQLDLNSIGQGYTIDRLAGIIRSFGVTDFWIEVGGEGYAGGHYQNQAWQIAIRVPTDVSDQVKIRPVKLFDQAIATSGIDQNVFIGDDGQRYSHILNPKTGYPITHSGISATVVAPTAELADALSTTLLVMGPEIGFQFLKRYYPEVSGLMIVRISDKAQVIATPKFPFSNSK